jgi:hypothetical protein
MRRILLTAFAASLLSGCSPEREYTTPTTEPGRVSKLIFLPSGHGSDVAVGFNTGKGGGVTVTPIDVDIPARYGIVFECTHGSFAVEGEKWVPLWKSLREGQKVTIRYREVYEIDRKAKTRTFVKFDFLGAVPEAIVGMTAEKVR